MTFKTLKNRNWMRSFFFVCIIILLILIYINYFWQNNGSNTVILNVSETDDFKKGLHLTRFNGIRFRRPHNNNNNLKTVWPSLMRVQNIGNVSNSSASASEIENKKPLSLPMFHPCNVKPKTDKSALKSCPLTPPKTGKRYTIVQSPIPTMEELEKNITWLDRGGRFVPEDCVANYSVAIIIPFRARPQQLMLYLLHIHNFLRTQQMNYTIFVVEQCGNKTYNKGRLMNIAFKMASMQHKFDCYIFNDVDLLPEDDRILYRCADRPKHLSIAINIYGYKRLTFPIFGGVTALTGEHFQSVNGFSNRFWGWGGEDDDFMYRVRHHGYSILELPERIARYTMLLHKKEKPNPNRHSILRNSSRYFDIDGLNNLNFTLVHSETFPLYTWYLVDVVDV